MFKKLLAAVAAVALAAGLVALVAAPASAHNSSVTATCQAGVKLNLTNYNASQPNTVKVVVDGVTAAEQDFGSSFTQTFPFAGGLASHSYQVVVHAWDNDKYSFDTGVVAVNNCETKITPAAPSANDAVCVSAGTVDGGGYTIPAAQTGVQYQRFDAVSNSWINVGAGTYAASVGSVIKIRAVATAGYKLTGTTAWTFTICAPEASRCVVPAVPTVTTAVCTSTPGSATVASYTVPTAGTGYTYSLQGSTAPLPAGTVVVSTFPTTVVIVATAAKGYTFPAKTTTSWTFTFTSPGECLGNSVAVAPTFTPAACTTTPGQSTDNSYTITATTGAHFQVKIGSGAFVDVLPGTYSLGTGASTVTIVALPDALYQLNGQTTFTHAFSAALDCRPVVVPVATSTPAVCDAAHPGQQTTGSYTLTEVPGVVYTVSTDGGAFQTTAAGTHPVVNGTDIQVNATASPGYQITGTSTWHFTFPVAGAGDCLASTTAGSVSFTDAICDVAHPGTALPGSFTIVPAAHVTYQASISSVGNGVYKPVSAGTHSTQPGDVVTVLAVPDAGYKISPPPVAADWTHTDTLALATCGDLVTHPLVDPTATQVQLQCFTGGSYTLGNSLNDAAAVIWTVDGARVPQGTYTVSTPGVVTVHAAANAPDYGLEQDATQDWTFTFTLPTNCDLDTHPLVDPTASQVQLQCFTGGSYSLGNDLNDAAAVIWTVNGSTVSAGTYKVSTAGTVTVHAEANGPAYGLEQGATQDWTFTFAAPTSCELKTLALTGSSPTGWIVLGYLMLIAGLVLVALRYVRRRGTQE